jgi:hypothetical protein
MKNLFQNQILIPSLPARLTNKPTNLSKALIALLLAIGFLGIMVLVSLV